MTRLRTITATAVAAGAFGGTIGALATAAVQSQAAPDAAATAQKVQLDQKDESLLHNIALNTYFNCQSRACRPPG